MGKRWAKRWTTSGKDHRRNKIHALRVLPSRLKDPLKWILPPSKSHLIRALLLAGQSPSPVDLEQVKNAGEDARAMRRCLQQLGVLIEDFDQDGRRKCWMKNPFITMYSFLNFRLMSPHTLYSFLNFPLLLIG